MPPTLPERIDAIEACYPLLLGYAGQGVSGEPGTSNVAEVRQALERAARALDGLADAFAAEIRRRELQPAASYAAFLEVLSRDAAVSLVSIQLVLAQPAVSSLLVDNLNASIHLRALLTDIFLLDEILHPRPRS